LPGLADFPNQSSRKITRTAPDTAQPEVKIQNPDKMPNGFLVTGL